MKPNKNHVWKNEWGESDRTSDYRTNEGSPYYYGYQRVHENEKAKFVLKHFNTVARKYDFMNTLLSFGIHHQWKRTAIRLLGLNEGDWVVDVCGGTGDLSLLAARVVRPSGRVMLYDINWAMIKRGQPKITGSYRGDCISIIQGDAERISFQDARFDAAMVGFGIRNLTRMEAGFSEMYRILKPGGRLMCLEFSKPTAPLFRWLYDFYSFHIMPLLGWLFVGSRKAYTYLPESIRMFQLPDEITAILKQIGFDQVFHRRLTNGIAVIHVAIKGGFQK
jgi:demethylmenaquinone methyltransferase/2-methoxy-6-polyprenyl-1,4-benzoquinol methylase